MSNEVSEVRRRAARLEELGAYLDEANREWLRKAAVELWRIETRASLNQAEAIWGKKIE